MSPAWESPEEARWWESQHLSAILDDEGTFLTFEDLDFD